MTGSSSSPLRIVTVLSTDPEVRAQAMALAERPELELSSYDALSNVRDEVLERADLVLIWLVDQARVDEAQLLRAARKTRLILVAEQTTLLKTMKCMIYFDSILFADMPLDRQVSALEMAASGYTLLPDDRSAKFSVDTLRLLAAEHISSRDIDVLLALRRGNTNKEIGNQLGVNESVVKACVRNVLARLSFSNRTEAALFALRCEARLTSIRRALGG